MCLSVLFNIFDHVIFCCVATCFMLVLANKINSNNDNNNNNNAVGRLTDSIQRRRIRVVAPMCTPIYTWFGLTSVCCPILTSRDCFKRLCRADCHD